MNLLTTVLLTAVAAVAQPGSSRVTDAEKLADALRAAARELDDPQLIEWADSLAAGHREREGDQKRTAGPVAYQRPRHDKLSGQRLRRDTARERAGR